LYLGVVGRAASPAVIWWRLMSSSKLCTLRLAVVAAACSALLTVGVASAIAAPDSDGQGYVDSTARCTTPDTAVAFGSTETSRVAICKTPGGQYEYRGVRVRDGAKLLVAAAPSGGGGFVAENNGTTYTVTARSLVVTVDEQVIREEPMGDFHGQETPKAPTATSAPSAPPTTTTPSAAPTTTTPTTPLPAERGYNGR
jgi:hypothetical protein